MDEVTAADSPQDYAREVVLASLRSHQNARNDRQLPLF
jgi:hypothetical protein